MTKMKTDRYGRQRGLDLDPRTPRCALALLSWFAIAWSCAATTSCSDSAKPASTKARPHRAAGALANGAQTAPPPAPVPDGVQTLYFDEAHAHKKSEGEFKGGKEEGAWTFWHDGGEIAIKGSFVHGSKDGVWTVFDKSGAKQSEMKWTADKVEGPGTEWYPNGQKKSEANFADGKLAGHSVEWHPNGQKKIAGDYKDGKKEGHWVSWHDNGQKSSEGEFKNDLQVGPWQSWFPNGKVEKSGTFVDGKHDGLWSSWRDDGQLEQQLEFKLDVQNGEGKTWYPNGQPGGGNHQQRQAREANGNMGLKMDSLWRYGGCVPPKCKGAPPPRGAAREGSFY